MFIAFLLFSCKKEAEVFVPNCNTSEKSFKNDVRPVMQNSCISCHSDYSSYANVATDKAKIREQVVTGEMPQEATLKDTEKNSIACWIDSVAKNN